MKYTLLLQSSIEEKLANTFELMIFSTLYTSIPHKLLKRQLAWVIRSAFKSSKKEYISVYSTTARWTSNPREDTTHTDCHKMIRVMHWLIDNIFVKFGDQVFRQVIGIPMGTRSSIINHRRRHFYFDL